MEPLYDEKTLSALRDRLTGSLIGLARATDGNEHLITPSSTEVIVESLFATLTDPRSDAAVLEGLLARVEQEKRKMVPDCFHCASPCGKNSDYDMAALQTAPEEIRALKSLLLLGIQSLAAHALSGRRDDTVNRFFYKALIAVGMDDFGPEELLPIVLEMGRLAAVSMTLPG
ncbi:MAG: hypothetical protein IJ001_11300 [Oscillospiraceae bacterium]|nr:hypothetical protein [Oscillospiraceae bacterium]